MIKKLARNIHHLLKCTGQRYSDIVAVGVAWPGAVVNNQIAGTSNTLREMTNLIDNQGRLSEKRFDSIRKLPHMMSTEFGVPTYLINDGNVLAFYHSVRLGKKCVLSVQLGTSVAGGYVDAYGSADYLMELGRICLDMGRDAPRHTFTLIRGLARECATQSALRRLMIGAGINEHRNEPVTRHNAGIIADDILQSGSRPSEINVVKRFAAELGASLGHLVTEVCEHCCVEHVVLSGGLTQEGSKFGDLLVQAATDLLKMTEPTIALERFGDGNGNSAESSRTLGATAAAYYASYQR